MARLHLVLVSFTVFLLCLGCNAIGEDTNAKTEDAGVEELKADSIGEGDGDLETAETKELFYALKSKVDAILQPFKSLKQGSYRQYYNVQPSYGYQTKYTPSYKQQILDCFDSGNGYAYGSGYTGGSAVPVKSYFIGGKPVYSSGGGAYSNNGYAGSQVSGSSSFGANFGGSSGPVKSYFIGGKPVYSSGGGGYSNNGYAGSQVSGSSSFGANFDGSSGPVKSYFIGGKPVYSSVGGSYSNNAYAGSQDTGTSSFGANFGGSANFGGGVSYSSNEYNTGSSSGGFRPSQPIYYSYTTYDSPTQSVGTSSGGQQNYNSQSYDVYKKSPLPTQSYYYSNSAPQLQTPQYVQQTVPLQQSASPPLATPIASPPSGRYDSKSFVYVSSPKSTEVETTSKAPPPSLSISIIVPPGQSESGVAPSVKQASVEVASSQSSSTPSPQPVSSQPPQTVIVSSTPQPQYNTESSTSVSITPRPQYSLQPISDSNPPLTGNGQGQSVLSIYSSDSILSRPNVYAPGNPSTGFYYYFPGYYNVGYGFQSSNDQQGYPAPGNSYQFSSAYPGSVPTVEVSGGNSETVSEGGSIVFPTSTLATPHVNCNH